ncbi:hypothetical protein AAC387_Pa12g1364 [Persea americana]
MGSGEAMGENQKEGSGSTESGCSRLPKDIISLRNYSISLFVSNLKPTISKVELEAMFCRSGRIVDSFILTKKSIEEDDVSVVFEGVPGRGSYNMRGMLFASSGSVDEEDNDDVRLTDELSNLKSPSSVDEFNSFSKRSTPDDFSSYPSSPVVALGDRGAENRGELQIVPAIAPINSAGFNTPTTSSGHVARNSWRPECSSQYRKSSDILSPIIRLVLYSSDSDDFSSPMKEACADDCDAEPTPISAYERDS